MAGLCMSIFFPLLYCYYMDKRKICQLPMAVKFLGTVSMVINVKMESCFFRAAVYLNRKSAAIFILDKKPLTAPLGSGLLSEYK